MNRNLLRAGKAIITLAVIAFVIRFIAKNLEKLNFRGLDINWWYVGIATIPFLAHLFLYSALWNKILGMLKEKLSTRESNRIYSISNLYRYIPGRVAMLLGKLYLCSEKGIAKPKCIMSMLLEQVFVLSSAIQVGLASLIFWNIPYTFKIIYLLGIAAIFLIIHPAIIGRIIALGMRIMKAKGGNAKLKYKTMSWLIIAYSLTWIVQGIAFYLVIASITGPSVKLLPIAIGIFSISTIVTNLIAVTPGGLGIKEGILILIGSSFIPLETITIAAIIARLDLLIAEILFFAIAKNMDGNARI